MRYNERVSQGRHKAKIRKKGKKIDDILEISQEIRLKMRWLMCQKKDKKLTENELEMRLEIRLKIRLKT